MEKIAYKLSEKISAYLHYNNDKKAVIVYGLIALFEMGTIAAVVIIVGMICNSWLENLIIFMSAGMLKKSTGGAHSKTLYGCILISVLSISAMGLLSIYIAGTINIYIHTGIAAVIYLVCLYLFYKYVPVDSPNKPITKPDKIKKLRRQSNIFLTLLILLSIILLYADSISHRYESFTISIYFAVLWQSFMLTKSGKKFIHMLDTKIGRKEV